MAMTATRLKGKGNGGLLVCTFTVVPSGSYATGGDVLDFALAGKTITNRQPDFVRVVGMAGFVYMYNYTLKKVLVFCNTAGGADAALGELTAAAYPAPVLADVIRGMAFWIGNPSLTS